MERERRDMPSSDAMLLIDDFEHWAEKVLSGTAWNYYKSAADREISKSQVHIHHSTHCTADHSHKIALYIVIP